MTVTARILLYLTTTENGHKVLWGILGIVIFLLFIFPFMAIMGVGPSDDNIGGALNAYGGQNISDQLTAFDFYYTGLLRDFQQNNLTPKRIKTSKPGYDDYRIQTSVSRTAMAFLLGHLQAISPDMKMGRAKEILDNLISFQYTVKHTVEIETEIIPGEKDVPVLDEFGEQVYDKKGNPVTIDEPDKVIEKRIYVVKVQSKSSEEITAFFYSYAQGVDFETYKELVAMYSSGEIRQFLQSPFGAEGGGGVRSAFGWRRAPLSKKPEELEFDKHDGVDIGKPEGTPLYAVMPGTVAATGYDTAGGNYIVIAGSGQHKGYETTYYHCAGITAAVGQAVDNTTQVGTVGSTGTNSTGAHLHLELRYKSKLLNPALYVMLRSAGGGDAWQRIWDLYQNSSESARIQSSQYSDGGNRMTSGWFDCSSFVGFVLEETGLLENQFGKRTFEFLPEFEAAGWRVEEQDAAPGDVVFWVIAGGRYAPYPDRPIGTPIHVGFLGEDGNILECTAGAVNGVAYGFSQVDNVKGFWYPPNTLMGCSIEFQFFHPEYS